MKELFRFLDITVLTGSVNAFHFSADFLALHFDTPQLLIVHCSIKEALDTQLPQIVLAVAVDGDIFDIEGKKCLVIGGAYSVDKFYRLSMGYKWWADEQPTLTIKEYVEQQCKTHPVDMVFSHTCPYKYAPTECFLPGLDQSTVDNSTEHWLDTIEEMLDYKAWYLGHWHINKRIDKLHFLMHDVEMLID